MFDFFKRKREYVSCEWLEYGVHFSPLGIEDCCMYVPKEQNYIPDSIVKNGEYDLNDFLKYKKKVKKQHSKGFLCKKCEGCYNLEKKVWNSKIIFTHLVLNLNYKCNSDCIYCFTHQNKKMYNKYEDVPVFEIIQDMFAKKMILPDCEVHLGGGEPTLNIEFESILNFLLDKKFNNIKIYSSGIKYSTAIERALKEGACKVYISPDAGNKDLYCKIKGVDKFDECWNNIKKYAKVQKNKESVCVKYIIIPSVNDNKTEIDSFLNKIIEVNIKFVVIDIERNWYNDNMEDEWSSRRILWHMNYIETFCDEHQIQHDQFPTCVYIKEKYPQIAECIEFDEEIIKYV